ncbi:thiamine-phosphate diphosphorylase [Nitrosomonas sp. PY1]|nr:thiamine-phosphate diphosphorylase [Nitrosomonas sp. PY1]
MQTGELLDKAQRVLQGGVKLLQYRNKSASCDLLREQAQALLSLCRSYHVPMIVNDDLDLAIEIDADGVHLGQDDLARCEAKEQLLEYDKILGISCYNRLDLALRAQQFCADYVAFGAFFSSTTKPDAVRVTVDWVRQAKKQIVIPIVSIGGIRLTNAASVIQSGCAAIAVSDDLFNAHDIQLRTQQLAQLFKDVYQRDETKFL